MCALSAVPEHHSLPYTCAKGHERISFGCEFCPLCKEIENASKMRLEYEAKIETMEYEFAEQQEELDIS